jgi:hypothetical protein
VQHRLEREDFVRAGRLTIGSSESERLKVCEKYEIQGDEILASWSRQEASHRWSYDPLKETPDLFLELAALRGASNFPEAALAFSHKRGLAGGNGFFEPAVSPANNPESITLSAFEEEASFAWFILRVYEAALNRDEEQLRIAAKCLEDYFQFENSGTNDSSGERDVSGALIQVALIVYKIFQKRCYIILSFTEEIESLETLTSGIRDSWEFGNLLDAAYLQMWWLMSSGGDVTPCNYCRRIMSLARAHPNGRNLRRDKRFCSDSCRQAHHRSKSRAQAVDA